MEGFNYSKYSALKYSQRQLVQDNLKVGKQLMADQLKAFKAADRISTSERVRMNGFIMQSGLKVEKIVE